MVIDMYYRAEIRIAIAITSPLVDQMFEDSVQTGNH
jgi:hypothetical protein